MTITVVNWVEKIHVKNTIDTETAENISQLHWPISGCRSYKRRQCFLKCLDFPRAPCVLTLPGQGRALSFTHPTVRKLLLNVVIYVFYFWQHSQNSLYTYREFWNLTTDFPRINKDGCVKYFCIFLLFHTYVV